MLDTCLISDIRRRRPAPTAWLASIPPGSGYLSVITIGEVQRGVQMAVSSQDMASDILESWFSEIRRTFVGRILAVTELVALERGRLAAGRTRPVADTYIAATALVHDLAVVTRNVRDFADTGFQVLNPWDPE